MARFEAFPRKRLRTTPVQNPFPRKRPHSAGAIFLLGELRARY
jgi:hypothetical protein